MPENKTPKNLQLRPSDELYSRFTVGRKLLGFSTDADMLKFCIDHTLVYVAEHTDEFIAERILIHEAAMKELEREAQEARKALIG